MLQVTCKAYASTFVGNWTYWLLKESTEALRKGCFLPPFPPHSRYRIKLRTTETAATWLYTKKKYCTQEKVLHNSSCVRSFQPCSGATLPFRCGWANTDNSLVLLGPASWGCLQRDSDDKDGGAPGTSLRAVNSASSAEELSRFLVTAVISRIWSSLLKTKVSKCQS